MGMDFVDMHFRIEKNFGLKLERDFWMLVIVPPQHKDGRFGPGVDIPVWKLMELICERVGATNTGFVMTTHNRQQVYEALRGCFGHDLNQLKPEALIEDLIPRDDRQKRWDQLGIALGRKLTPLTRSPVFTYLWLASGLGMVVSIVCAVLAAIGAGTYALSVGGWIGALVVSSLGFALLRNYPVCDQIPANCTTVDHLVEYVTTVDTRQRSQQHETIHRASASVPPTWTDEAVWFVLRDTLVDALGVDEDEITMDAKLIQDLGCS